MKSIVFALAIAVVVAEESPLQPYVSPFQFCKELPAGRYCNGKFSRGFVTCPTSLEEFCPQNTVCSAGPTLGTPFSTMVSSFLTTCFRYCSMCAQLVETHSSHV